MAVIIEGHDNSGKSTLACLMGKYLRMQVQESEGPPKSDDEINTRVDAYARMSNTIFVRHPVISNSIYGQFREEGDPITEDRRKIFYDQGHVIIYCDAQCGYEGHQVKGHDTEEHLKLLDENAAALLQAYRLWAAQHAHFIYRIGDYETRLIDTVKFYLSFRDFRTAR